MLSESRGSLRPQVVQPLDRDPTIVYDLKTEHRKWGSAIVVLTREMYTPDLRLFRFSGVVVAEPLPKRAATRRWRR